MSILCDLCWKAKCLPQPARGMLAERLCSLVTALTHDGSSHHEAAREIARLRHCVDLYARMN